MEDEMDNTPAEVESTQDEQADTAEEVSAPESQVSQEETQEVKEERLYAGKFKSPEELEKGYENLQSLLGKKSNPEPVPEVLKPAVEPTQDEVLASLADENGNIDPVKLIEYTEARAVDRVERKSRAKEFEQNDWSEAVKEFPELNENTPESKKLAALIKNQRYSELISGEKYRPYKEVAKEIVGLFKTASKEGKEQGREEAQVSERIVERSSLVTPNNNSDSGVTEEQQLLKEMGSLDHEVAKKARLKYLEKYN